MKKIFIFTAVSVITLTNSYAADKAISTDQADSIFKKMDGNHDNFVTMDEVKIYHKNFYDELDVNKNGKLTISEAKEKGKDVNKFNELDVSGKDKILSFDESLKSEESRFQQADTNKDGKVSWDEYKPHYENTSN